MKRSFINVYLTKPLSRSTGFTVFTAIMNLDFQASNSVLSSTSRLEEMFTSRTQTNTISPCEKCLLTLRYSLIRFSRFRQNLQFHVSLYFCPDTALFVIWHADHGKRKVEAHFGTLAYLPPLCVPAQIICHCRSMVTGCKTTRTGVWDNQSVLR